MTIMTKKERAIHAIVEELFDNGSNYDEEVINSVYKAFFGNDYAEDFREVEVPCRE